jgi:hypothetical protein
MPEPAMMITVPLIWFIAFDSSVVLTSFSPGKSKGDLFWRTSCFHLVIEKLNVMGKHFVDICCHGAVEEDQEVGDAVFHEKLV